MSRRRFFVDEVRRGEAELAGEEAEHLTRVLRAENGQRYEVCDGSGLYLGEIVEVRKRSVRFRILEELPVELPAVRITLLMSLIKFERLEWTIEKATELGAAKIIAVEAERSDKGLELAAGNRLERWRKIARAAGQQSHRVNLPEILPPVKLREAVTEVADRRFYLEEQPGAPLLRKIAIDPRPGESVAALVGPEGGWTERERENLAAAGWNAVSLGAPILRAETAAVSAIALIAHAWEPG